MTVMSPPSLFLHPHIVEPGPSANLAGHPLGGVPGVTRSVRISDRGGGPVSQFC